MFHVIWYVRYIMYHYFERIWFNHWTFVTIHVHFSQRSDLFVNRTKIMIEFAEPLSVVMATPGHGFIHQSQYSILASQCGSKMVPKILDFPYIRSTVFNCINLVVTHKMYLLWLQSAIRKTYLLSKIAFWNFKKHKK